MKIVAVHGDDTKTSRDRFVQITKGVKKKGWDVVYLDPNSDFETQLSSKSLFGDENLYVIEEASSLSATKIDWISKNNLKFNSQLLLYSKKLIPAATLKRISKDIKSEKFEVTKNIFKFTDSLLPGNGEVALKLLRELEENKEPLELLIALIAKNFRDMLWVLHGGKGLAYPDWRIKKLRAQAGKFTKHELGDIIANLAEIDYKSKTTDVDAFLLLEMLILEKLC